MLTMVEVRTPQGTLLSLPLADSSSGIEVRDIGGLEAVKATLASSSFANLPGAQFQSSHRETRNITMKLGLQPVTGSVKSLRTMLYSFLMPESTVSLRFYDEDGTTVDIAGTVETFDSPLFSADPEASISIMCFQPDFVSTVPIVVSGVSVSDSTEIVVTYNGSIKTGFEFVYTVAGHTVSEFTIYNRLPDGTTQSLDFQGGLAIGDVVTISTVTGDKSVTKVDHLGVGSSVLYAMTPQSTWLNLYPGDNHIRVYSTALEAGMDYQITYSEHYGGL